MKAKSVQYSIQNPCDESWNKMTPESNGRFCGSCQKTVIDFTGMPDFSIVNYLEGHKNEKICGRFTKPQLDRVYNLNQPVFAPSFDLRAVVLGLALTTFCAVHSFAQTEPHQPIDTAAMQVEPPIVGKIAYQHFDHQKERKTNGTIQNSGRDFKEIDVALKNEEGTILKIIHPDAKGKFEFDLNWKLRPASIEISGTGYERQELYFSSFKSLDNIQVILLDEVEMIRGEVIQGDVKVIGDATEDQILQKIVHGNVSVEKKEK